MLTRVHGGTTIRRGRGCARDLKWEGLRSSLRFAPLLTAEARRLSNLKERPASQRLGGKDKQDKLGFLPAGGRPTTPTGNDVPPSGRAREKSELVAQDHAQEAAVHRQRAAARVINEAQRPELVHEMADPRPGGAHHLGQVFLIDSGMDSFGSAFLAKMRQQ